jgi:hypothetical protein
MAKRTAKRNVAVRSVPTVIEASIRVDRQVREGWHIYTSKQLPGLLVVSKDERKAYGDLPSVIETLISADFGIECRVVHKIESTNLRDIRKAVGRATAAIAERTKDLLSGPRGHLSLVIQYDRVTAAHA